ncbi:PAS domain-containing protein [Trinickia violacea]|uniref:PAS domain-containing protein n=1 Tax=Trinickia violacea TaxID=2571746 RepID=A0A4P8J044_9BURK|nr:PAS domain-containing protein [Trinickia violacea]QCP54271.1 PAS domain-containing protein [Trinickia violacea]
MLATPIQDTPAPDDELSIFQSITGRMQGFLYRQLNDADFTVIYATASIRNVTGYPREDFLGNAVRTLPSLTEPDDEVYVLDIVQDALRKREPWTVDYRIKTAKRGSLWVREMGGGVFDENGELLFLEGLVIEVQGERAARLASEKRLRAITGATGTILEDVDDILRAIRALSILSFNARVEAARAGNTGRGFAVVAAEMKRLADDTDKLAKQISTHVNAVRHVMEDK